MSNLEQWINPEYLKSETIKSLRESSLARPFLNYLVLDDFFLDRKYQEISDNDALVEFKWDEPSESFRRKLSRENVIDAFFLSEEWGLYLKTISGAPSEVNGKCVVANEMKQEAGTSGYWIHSDKHSPKHEIKLISLFYLKENREKPDGGLLQLWRRITDHSLTPAFSVEMKDYLMTTPRRKLDFLTQQTEIIISEKDNPKPLVLIDEIVPKENRLVIMNLARDSGFHSVTPIEKKKRRVISQFFI